MLGRISPEKRPDRAIEIAGRAGVRLRIAAKVDRADRAYFADCIAPILRQPHVDFPSEIDERGKQELLGGALARVLDRPILPPSVERLAIRRLELDNRAHDVGVHLLNRNGEVGVVITK